MYISIHSFSFYLKVREREKGMSVSQQKRATCLHCLLTLQMPTRQVWARLMVEFQNCIVVSHVGGRGTQVLDPLPLLPKMHVSRNWVRSRLDSNPVTIWYRMSESEMAPQLLLDRQITLLYISLFFNSGQSQECGIHSRPSLEELKYPSHQLLPPTACTRKLKLRVQSGLTCRHSDGVVSIPNDILIIAPNARPKMTTFQSMNLFKKTIMFKLIFISDHPVPFHTILYIMIANYDHQVNEKFINV